MGQFYEGLGEELSLYVRQVAWLLAIPKVKDSRGVETKLPARIDPYRAQKAEPPLPPLVAQHVYDWLMEVGPVEAGGMGQVPLSWTAIRDWAGLTFKRLTAWEARLLRRLSAEYLTESHAAEDHNRPAPWSPGRSEVDQQDQERRLRAVLG